jgi:large subunit ribosomal protein L35e
MATKVRAHEIRNKKKDELLRQLDELKQELVSLRVQKIAGSGNTAKLTKMWVDAIHR